MESYHFLLQHNPHHVDTPEFHQEGFFFNEIDHLRQQANGPFYLLTAVNQFTQRADIRCAFFSQRSQVVSPAEASFGSIEFNETLPDAMLDQFLDVLLSSARLLKKPTLRLVNYPDCYAPSQANRLTAKLFRHGFQLVASHQNAYLPISNRSFEQVIQSQERRRLRACQRANFHFHQWVNPVLADVVNFITDTRQTLGYRLTLSPERLAKLLHTFPDKFLVFCVTDGSKLAALAITVRVRHDILYYFMPASNPAYRIFSPMVMLVNGLFTYCQHNHIQLLDLGVSLDNFHNPKPSLMRFKRNLGASESPKLIFEKAL
ncbi:GNAT family N-acetyltransferase [Spirosoma aerolatum]|uniref:GNAT family N-acetyltransferase n=1 Tax=Spirosoma aerolatum TaxID=1211326 RepID=UPI0009AD22E7|nr:GNAT family N-acetyltransferase [Spirosoma aerolatum]